MRRRFGRRGQRVPARPAAVGIAAVASNARAARAALASGKLPSWTALSALRLLVAVIGIIVALCVTVTSLGDELVRDLRLAGSGGPPTICGRKTPIARATTISSRCAMRLLSRPVKNGRAPR